MSKDETRELLGGTDEKRVIDLLKKKETQKKLSEWLVDLLQGHVASHQVTHHAVVAKVTLAGLTDTSLKGNKKKSINIRCPQRVRSWLFAR